MKILLPHLADVVVSGVRRIGSTIRIAAESRGERGRCPRCGGKSTRTHSRYRRQLSDTATGGHPVVIYIKVRRFFCDTIDCTAQTFAEQIPNLTQPTAPRAPSRTGFLSIRVWRWCAGPVPTPKAFGPARRMRCRWQIAGICGTTLPRR
ncbi:MULTISPECIES: transposase family protein [Rhodococcus]|uniref:transposase family protein n=1 Tax=Rhodococcus TaxID=1827 RepID=UPI001E5BB659|nr:MULTISPECIES: transposase family protein [Rhodococcus]MCD2135670.1 transposase family protein [Rhodococcus qingshengii]